MNRRCKFCGCYVNPITFDITGGYCRICWKALQRFKIDRMLEAP